MAAIFKTGEDIDTQKMENQREKLVELIESQFGLLEKLLKMHAITRNQLEQIECEPTRFKINKMMLDYIFHENKHEDLITALSESSQSHVANWIKRGGEYSEEFGLDWPLTEAQQEILDANLEELIDIIDNGELISMLYSGQVINKRQRVILRSKSTDPEKNKALLGIVRRLSQRSFQTLINCLRKSKQGHIADILQNGGAILPVHVSMETDNLDETETQIVYEVTNLLLQRTDSAEQANRVLNATQLNIIAVKRGRSVVLYICCRTENELNDLCKKIDNSKIKNFLEKLFVTLTCNINFKVLSVKINKGDVKKARKILRKITAEVDISQKEKTTINSIPLEVFDVIIQKSFAIFIQIKSQIDDGKYQEGFKQLAEVNVCWFKRMTKRRFKNDRWSYLSVICKRRNSISSFWKINRQFIEENVFQIRTGANILKHHDLLSDIQCALIALKSSTVKKSQASNKATDLSLILNYKDGTIANLFSEYLRLSKPCRISKAMRNCGTSVRVEINSRSPIEDGKITRFFKDSGCEILGSMKDRDFVRWIWCKSLSYDDDDDDDYYDDYDDDDPEELQQSFCHSVEESLKELQQSNYLRHPFSHFPQRINETRINVDSDQLKKKAMVLPHIFDESLETMDEQRRAVGVTKLRNEIYFLSYYGEVKVFCDRYPFVLLRKFQFKEFNEAKDIVSCDKENALYILDVHVCVWKTQQNSKTNINKIKWLELPDDFQPLTLSMSKSDQLLMVSKDPLPSLRIYGPDAQLRLSISLRQNMQYPIHAVETSTGNFVILHLLKTEGVEETELTITTLSGDGKTIVHNYQPKNEEQRLNDVTNFFSGYLSIDSNDRVFVADHYNARVILLDSNLRWNQILFPKNEGKAEDMRKIIPLRPHRLYYDEGKKQLVVCGYKGVEIVFLNKF